jgi:hypothetical protein
VSVVETLDFAFDCSSAFRIAVLRAANQSQRALIAAAVGTPVRIGGITLGAASAPLPARNEADSNSAIDLRMKALPLNG